MTIGFSLIKCICNGKRVIRIASCGRLGDCWEGSVFIFLYIFVYCRDFWCGSSRVHVMVKSA